MKSLPEGLRTIARSQKWTFETLPEVSSYPSSYQGLEWRDSYGACVGRSLHTLNISAVSTQKPEWGLPSEFHLTSQEPLFEALSADGSLILPGTNWLLAPLTEANKEALLYLALATTGKPTTSNTGSRTRVPRHCSITGTKHE